MSLNQGQINVYSISDYTGTTAPSAGPNGSLGYLALKNETISTVNGVTGSENNINLTSDGTIDITPIGNGEVQISLYQEISANLNVSSINVSGVGSVSQNSIENGMIIDQVILDWDNYNKTPTSQSLNQGIGSLSTSVTDYTHNDTFISNRTYTLSYTDGVTPGSSSETITFKNRRFWGSTSLSTNLNESDIEAGYSELSTSRGKSITFTPNGNRIFYAYPTSYGLATVKDSNGLTFQSWIDGGVEVTTPYTISITNDYGITQNYYVYQSYNSFGTSSITFVWS